MNSQSSIFKVSFFIKEKFLSTPPSQILFLWICFSALFLFVNLESFKGEFYPISDIAANDFQMVDIQNGKIGLGAYSRFQFNHPGPIYFYLAAIGEKLFFFLEANTSRHALVSYCINVVFLGFLFYNVSNQFKSLLVGLVIWFASFFVWKSLGYGILFETWTPFLMISTFSVFTLSTVYLSLQKWKFLPWFVITGSILFQLNVMGVMPLLAGILFLVYRYWGLKKLKELIWIDFQKYLLISIVFGLLIWLPVILDFFVHFPGNISRVFAYLLKGGGNKKPIEVFTFLKSALEILFFLPSSGFFYGILILIPFWKSEHLDSFTIQLRNFCFFYTLFLFLTLFRMKGPILPHLFWHFYSVVAFQILLFALAIWQEKLNGRIEPVKIGGILLILLFSILLYGKQNVRDRNLEVKTWTNAIEPLGDKFLLHWDTNPKDFEQGTLVLGIAAELNRRGKTVCFQDPWLFLVPKTYHCYLNAKNKPGNVSLLFKTANSNEANLIRDAKIIQFNKSIVELGN